MRSSPRTPYLLQSWFARLRHPNRMISEYLKKVEANRANQAKGPAGRLGSRLRAELAKRNQRLPLLGDDDTTADRNYIKEFLLARNRELGRKYGVEYAEAFHYIGPGASGAAGPRTEEYIRQHVAPLK